MLALIDIVQLFTVIELHFGYYLDLDDSFYWVIEFTIVKLILLGYRIYQSLCGRYRVIVAGE